MRERRESELQCRGGRRWRDTNLYEIFFNGESQPIHCVSTMIGPLAKLGRCFSEVHVCSDGAVDKSLGIERERERERERETAVSFTRYV